jgi:hypothetical protein
LTWKYSTARRITHRPKSKHTCGWRRSSHGRNVARTRTVAHVRHANVPWKNGKPTRNIKYQKIDPTHTHTAK